MRWYATPAQAEIGARVRTGGYPHPYRTAGSRHCNRAPENSFRYRHREYQPDVITITLKEGMRGDLDLDQGVTTAGPECSSITLAAQPQDMPVRRAGRDLDVKRPAIGQHESPCCTIDGVEEVSRERVALITPMPRPGGTMSAAEHIPKNVAKIVGIPPDVCEPGAP